MLQLTFCSCNVWLISASLLLLFSFKLSYISEEKICLSEMFLMLTTVISQTLVGGMVATVEHTLLSIITNITGLVSRECLSVQA